VGKLREKKAQEGNVKRTRKTEKKREAATRFRVHFESEQKIQARTATGPEENPLQEGGRWLEKRLTILIVGYGGHEKETKVTK